jgi:hypothetical protein
MDLPSILMEEDSICYDLLAIGIWLFKLGLLWNAVTSIEETVASMRPQDFLLLFACSIQLDFALPSRRQAVCIMSNLVDRCRSFVVGPFLIAQVFFAC